MLLTFVAYIGAGKFTVWFIIFVQCVFSFSAAYHKQLLLISVYFTWETYHQSNSNCGHLLVSSVSRAAINCDCHVITCNFIPFMGSQGLLLEPIPAVSGIGQSTSWTSCKLIAAAFTVTQGAKCTSGAILGFSIQHFDMQLNSARSRDLNQWPSDH